MGKVVDILKFIFIAPKGSFHGLHSKPTFKDPQTCKKCGVQKRGCKFYDFTLAWSEETKLTAYLPGYYQTTTTYKILGKEGAFLCPKCRRKYVFHKQLINFFLGVVPGIITILVFNANETQDLRATYIEPPVEHNEKMPTWQKVLLIYAMAPGLYFAGYFFYLFITLPNFFENQVIHLCEKELMNRFDVDYISKNGGRAGNLCVFTSEGAWNLQKKYGV